MDGEATNQTVTGQEPVGASGAGQAPESTASPQVSASQVTPDWYKAIPDDAPDDDVAKFLEEHPKAKVVLERKAQSHADRVLAKTREQVIKEERESIRQQAQSEEWTQRWARMTPQQKGEFLLRNQEMQEQLGKTLGNWWIEQSQGIKELIPEFKDKAIEDWARLIEAHPASFKDLISAAISEVAGIRLEKDLPKKVREAVEAEVKNRIANTLAGSETPDLRSGSATGSFAGLSASEMRQRVKAMAPAEYEQHQDEIWANLPYRR